MSFIYLIKAGDYYKIGMSSNVEKRVYSIQTEIPYEITQIHTFEADNPREAERFLHRIFRHKRINGEWFNLSTYDLSFLSTIAGYSDGSFTWSTVPLLDIDKDELLRENKTYKLPYRDEIIEITERQILEFLRMGWKRQENGKEPLTEKYWRKIHRPALKTAVYRGIINILVESGIIINRWQGRSGELALPPNEAILLLVQPEC